MIYVSNSTRRRLNLRALERDARLLLNALGKRDASLSIALVGDGAIRRLNAEYRGTDRPTDVLSFGSAEPGVGRPARRLPEHSLGDVIISLDRAALQAKEYAAPLEREVRRLLIHGCLHLVGHDHQEAAERARMVREERRLAALIGLPWPYGDDANSPPRRQPVKTTSRRT